MIWVVVSIGPAGEIEIENCGLDLTLGTPNRDIIEFLINAGIDVIYLEGNTVN